LDGGEAKEEVPESKPQECGRNSAAEFIQDPAFTAGIRGAWRVVGGAISCYNLMVSKRT